MLQITAVLLIAISLAFDALCVAISDGITTPGFRKRQAFLIGLYFGAFQFCMPIIGWLLGAGVSGYIAAVDHWIAFGLLAVIGGRMIWESLRKKENHDAAEPKPALTHRKLVVQAFATSIDALAVGVSLAVMQVNIWNAAAVIGLVAFAFSVFGALMGRKLGMLFQKSAETAGGLILIAIGARILLEHFSAG